MRTPVGPTVAAAVGVVGVAVALVAGVLSPTPLAARPAGPPPGLEPIVFVHGLHDSSAAFTTMVQRFRDAGVPEDRLWAWNYDSRQSNVDSADDFAAFVTGVRLETGAARVDVVAHSMGALPTRWCIRFGPCRRVVDDWVSLAGPNHGSNITLTCLLFPGEEGCPEMAVGSSFLDQLNEGDETPGQVDYTTIRTTDDQIISPSDSTELAGAPNLVFEGLAHNDLLTEPAVFAKVAAVVFDGVAPGGAGLAEAAAVPAEGSVPSVPPRSTVDTAADESRAAGRTGIIVAALDSRPNAARDVAFTLCRGASTDCRTFTLDDDADPVRQRRARHGGLAVGRWKLSQSTPPGWALAGITCDTDERVQLHRARAVIELQAGEKSTCTFTIERSTTTSTTSTSSTTTTSSTTSTSTTSTSTTSTSTTTTSTTTTAPPPPPANDAVAAAQALPFATGTTRGSNERATVEAGEPQHAEAAPTRTVWYRWTAGLSAAVAVDTCASAFDTVLAVYSGPATGPSVDGLSEIAADEDTCGAQSRLRFASVAGTTYYLAVGGYGGAQGEVVLRRSLVTGPVSDAFSATVPLAPGGGTLDVATGFASSERSEPSHAGNPAAHSVWYSWTAPADGPVTFDTCGSDFDTVLAVSTGDALTALSPVAAADDTCELGARVGFDAIAGTTYRIAVDGFHGATGTATLSWG
ncbi:MAG: hypothetical protein JNK12_25380 [Acidimicrobiales bacterium]|nr:hypothetical protein [Acidimicrobiales bacterium]